MIFGHDTHTRRISCRDALIVISVDCPREEPLERRFPGIAVQRIGRLLEFDAVKQPLDVTGYSVCGHYQSRINRMDVLAGHRTL